MTSTSGPPWARSYRRCGSNERRLFRLLGLLAPSVFSAEAAAGLLDTTVTDAEALLERLVDAQLVEVAGEDQAGRLQYRLHDLIRIFAAECLEAEEPARTRSPASV